MNQQEFRFTIETNEEIRVDKFLADNLPGVSRSKIKACIEAGDVTLDGKVVDKAGTKAKLGSVLELILVEDDEIGLIPESFPLDTIYEDAHVIIINKPAGIVVHPGAGNQSGTIVNYLLSHFPPIRLVGEVERPGVVHRLDKETSGCMIFAKSDKAYRWLVKQFKSHDVSKSYLTLVDGRPPTPTGRIEAPIERDSKNRTKMAVGIRGSGKEAITEYFQLETFKDYAYLETHPLTGRTHQIRVHLSYIGVPVVGDTLYGRKRSTIQMDRFFLHAHKLTIRLPGDRQARTFEAPLPDDLFGILDQLREKEKVR